MQSFSKAPPVISVWQREPVAPVAPDERIQTLDVLRGFALFGILLVNMTLFSWPIYDGVMGTRHWQTRTDVIADAIVRVVAEGKFYPLFAFLFGLGAAIQMDRAEWRGAGSTRLFCRRLTVLLGIGLVHAFLIWEGDILVMYALFGFLLLAFRKRQPKTLLVWAALCMMVPLAIYAAAWALISLGSLVPEIAREIDREFARAGEMYPALAEENLEVFAHGSFVEILIQRAKNVVFAWQFAWLYAPTFFAMFLVGLYAARRRILHEADNHSGFLRRVFWWSLAIGLPMNVVYALGYSAGDPLRVDLIWLCSVAGLTVGGPALCLAYAAGFALLLRRSGWQKRARPLAAAGRMALSNYLLQSLVCTTIFYSYGLGWYGSVGRAAGLGLALLIYAAQIPLSVWWLRHFRFGPAEWLWRSLTYGRRQPMRN